MAKELRVAASALVPTAAETVAWEAVTIVVAAGGNIVHHQCTRLGMTPREGQCALGCQHHRRHSHKRNQPTSCNTTSRSKSDRHYRVLVLSEAARAAGEVGEAATRAAAAKAAVATVR